MRYTVFEQAASEARAGMKEIDAEIDRLKARRELLEVLETISRQLLTVVPMSAGPVPITPGNKPAIDEPSGDSPDIAKAATDR